MKSQEHDMAVPYRRWRAAQEAEREHFRIYKDALSIQADFLYQNFTVGSESFENKAILEVGCSPIANIHSLGQAALRVGVDPLAFEYRGSYDSEVNHIQACGENLPFQDESFDLVLCINTLDHVRSPFSVLQEISRVLKKEGTLFLWLQTFSIFRTVRVKLSLIDTPHPHHLSDNEVLTMLLKLGSVNYHQRKRVSFKAQVSAMRGKRAISRLRSLCANLFLGLYESSYLCSKSGLRAHFNAYKEVMMEKNQ